MEEDQFFFSRALPLLLLYVSRGRARLEDLASCCYCHLFTVAETMHRNIFSFHFNCCSCLCPAAAATTDDVDDDGVYRYATLPLSCSLLFLRFFFSIRLTLATVSALLHSLSVCPALSLSLSSLFALLQSTLFASSYVFLTLHIRVLFRCVPYVYIYFLGVG